MGPTRAGGKGAACSKRSQQLPPPLCMSENMEELGGEREQLRPESLALGPEHRPCLLAPEAHLINCQSAGVMPSKSQCLGCSCGPWPNGLAVPPKQNTFKSHPFLLPSPFPRLVVLAPSSSFQLGEPWGRVSVGFQVGLRTTGQPACAGLCPGCRSLLPILPKPPQEVG